MRSVLLSIILAVGSFSFGQEAHFFQQVSSVGQQFDLNLSNVPDVNGSVITIRNTSWGTLDVPVIAPSATIVPSSTLRIAQQITASVAASDDETVVIAIWNYVLAHTNHYCSAGATGDPGGYASDP